MYPFIESIRLHDGKLMNMEFHQLRFEKTRRENLRLRRHPLLEETIPVPDGLETGIFKCRVTYGKEIGLVEFDPYQKRIIRSLKMVYSDTVSYGYKYANRNELDTLFSFRGGCDDILIVKEGFITDSYYANVVFWDGKKWITPDTPLLRGTMRAFLLACGKVKEQRIRPEDLGKYRVARLINALNNIEDSPDIPVESILL